VQSTGSGYCMIFNEKKISLTTDAVSSKPLIADYDKASFFYKSDLVLMDIIASNLVLHPCYFSQMTIMEGAAKALRKIFRQRD
jgi:hypothetical protein